MNTMNRNKLVGMVFLAVLLSASSGFERSADAKIHVMASMKSTHRVGTHRRHRGDMLVAYDAKDKRYYSVLWAKAHHMKDRGGDTLILIRKSRLPKEAKMSRAMKGKM